MLLYVACDLHLRGSNEKQYRPFSKSHTSILRCDAQICTFKATSRSYVWRLYLNSQWTDIGFIFFGLVLLELHRAFAVSKTLFCACLCFICRSSSRLFYRGYLTDVFCLTKPPRNMLCTGHKTSQTVETNYSRLTTFAAMLIWKLQGSITPPQHIFRPENETYYTTRHVIRIIKRYRSS